MRRRAPVSYTHLVLMEHPAVLECAVTGAPDPVRGIVVKATIVLTSSYQPSEELKKELQTFVKKQTAPYKYPRIVEFVTEPVSYTHLGVPFMIGEKNTVTFTVGPERLASHMGSGRCV